MEDKDIFKKISLLPSDLLFTHCNPSLDMPVISDASGYAIRAVISHVFHDGSQKAIAHAARSLTPVERNYGQTEKETLAIIFAIMKLHKMLNERKFTLITDHTHLANIFGSKKVFLLIL